MKYSAGQLNVQVSSYFTLFFYSYILLVYYMYDINLSFLNGGQCLKTGAWLLLAINFLMKATPTEVNSGNPAMDPHTCTAGESSTCLGS